MILREFSYRFLQWHRHSKASTTRFLEPTVHQVAISIRSSPVDDLRLSSAQYAIKHNINSADAILLAILLALQATTVASDDELPCLAANKRLIRASRAEGLRKEQLASLHREPMT